MRLEKVPGGFALMKVNSKCGMNPFIFRATSNQAKTGGKLWIGKSCYVPEELMGKKFMLKVEVVELAKPRKRGKK